MLHLSIFRKLALKEGTVSFLVWDYLLFKYSWKWVSYWAHQSGIHWCKVPHFGSWGHRTLTTRHVSSCGIQILREHVLLLHLLLLVQRLRDLVRESALLNDLLDQAGVTFGCFSLSLLVAKARLVLCQRCID